MTIKEAIKPTTIEDVVISSITRDLSLQIRSRMNEPTVNKYRDCMKNGQEFPPVRLAKIDDSLILVDGWHRLEAAILLGRHSIIASIQTMSPSEAAWEAAAANLTHGLPLKSAEYREVFRVFVKAGKNRRGRSYLSYRDIALIVGSSHMTIRRWMELDFPRLFRAMSKDSEHRPDTPPPDFRIRQAEERLLLVSATVDDAVNQCVLMNETDRGILIFKVEAALLKMKEQPFEIKLEEDF